MRKDLFTVASVFVLFQSIAQDISIGIPVPDASAALEIKAGNRGLLIPRTSGTSRNAIVNPAKGLLLYDSTTGSFWFHNGSVWGQTGVPVIGWSLNGNTGTNATHYLGTTDKQPLWFRVNNNPSGLIDTGTNTFLGYNTGSPAIEGSNNTGIGLAALGNNTGDFNTATGAGALAANTTGSLNTASGFNALTVSNGTGNTASGANTLASNTGSYNTATGLNSLKLNNTGINNTATGVSSLEQNTGGTNNTAHGMYSLYSNKTGQQNTANGYSALYTNDGGSYNTAYGVAALYKNTGASYNTANGTAALYSNTSGVANTASGDSSLYNNSTGSTNTADGSHSLYSNTEGNYNTASGHYALWKNTINNTNTAIGYQALYANVVSENTGVGADALLQNDHCICNTAVGVRALRNSKSKSFDCADYNTAIGLEALKDNTWGWENVAIGYRSLASGSGYIDFTQYSTAIGSNTGYNNNSYPQGSTYIGAYAESPNQNLAGANAAIGYNAKVGDAGIIRIGDNYITVVESAAGSWTVSDGRFKNEIKEDIKGLAFIKLLRPVSYHFDAEKFDEFLIPHVPGETKPNGRLFSNTTSVTNAPPSRQSGFLAQEVADAARKSGYDFSGIHAPGNPKDNWSLSYEQLIIPLVKALQEQQKRIAFLKEENARLKEMQAEIEQLKVALLQQQP